MQMTPSRAAGLAGAGIVLLAGSLFGSSGFAAGEKAGRYTMSPADGGGFVRLDTESGAMALCRPKGGDWACTDMADGGGAPGEMQRLREENAALKAEVRRLEDIVLPEKKSGEPPVAARPGGRIELPSEEDVDKAMTYFGRLIRKFREKLKEFEDDGRGTQL
jgi:hypothetical protein